MHHFDTITQQIIEAVEHGTEECSMPWHCLGSNIGQPRNAATGKGYRGLNTLALAMATIAGGYSNSRWASVREWIAIGAQVRKAEKSTPIFFWRPSASRSDEGNIPDDRRYRGYVARTYAVFNEAQVDGAPTLDAATTLPKCECARPASFWTDWTRL